MLGGRRTVDWRGLFEPHHVIENVIRASSIHLMLFLLLRFLPNRKTGSLVKHAYIEHDGRVSVIRKDRKTPRPARSGITGR